MAPSLLQSGPLPLSGPRCTSCGGRIRQNRRAAAGAAPAEWQYPEPAPCWGSGSSAVNSYSNNEIKEEENGMGVGGRAVFSLSSSSSRDPWRGGLQVLGDQGSWPSRGQRLTWSPLPQLGDHSLQPARLLLPLPPPSPPSPPENEREKQKAMGRSSGSESDVAAALRPQLSRPAGVGQGAGPWGGNREPCAASALGTRVHARSHPHRPLRNDRLRCRPRSCAHQTGAAQPPPAVTPLGRSMLGVVVLPLLTRFWQVANDFSSPVGPSLSGVLPQE